MQKCEKISKKPLQFQDKSAKISICMGIPCSIFVINSAAGAMESFERGGVWIA